MTFVQGRFESYSISRMHKRIRKLTTHGAIFGIGAASNSIAGFILIPFYLKELSAAEYGNFALYETFLLAALTVFGMGLNVVILSRWHRLTPANRAELVSGLLSYAGVVGLASLLFAIFFSVFVFELAGLLVLSALAGIVFLELIWLVISTVYRAESRVRRYVVTSFVRVVGGIVATVLVISLTTVREDGIFYGRLIGDLAALICVGPYLRKVRLTKIDKQTTELLRLGAPLVPVTFAVTVMTIIPRYIVEWLSGTEAVGTFVMSAKIAGLVTLLFVQPFSLSWMPQLFSLQRSANAKTIYANTALFYVLLACAVGAIGSLLVPPMVAVLSSYTFPLSSFVIVTCMIGLLIVGAMHTVNVGPYVKDKTSAVLPAFMVALVVMLVFVVLLTWTFGIEGTAIGILAAQLAQIAGLYRVNQRMYRIPFRIGQTASVIVATTICALALYALEVWLEVKFLAAALMLGVCVLVFLAKGRKVLRAGEGIDIP